MLGGGDGLALVQHDPNSEEEMEQEPGPVAFVSKATMDNTTEQLIQTLDHKNRLIETLFYGLECVEYDKSYLCFSFTIVKWSICYFYLYCWHFHVVK